MTECVSKSWYWGSHGDVMFCAEASKLVSKNETSRSEAV